MTSIKDKHWQTDDNVTVIEFGVSRSLRVQHLRGDDWKRAIKEQYLHTPKDYSSSRRASAIPSVAINLTRRKTKKPRDKRREIFQNKVFSS